MYSTKEAQDITADIGNLESGKLFPMYSFERPACYLWQAIYTGLIERGLTHLQAIDWLQSKQPRWALDDDLGDQIRMLGKSFARTANISDFKKRR